MNKFKNFVPAVLAILGLKTFSEENGRKVLTAMEKQKLTASGFPAQFIKDFEEGLNEPEASAENTEEGDHRVAALSAVLGQTTTKLTSAQSQLEAMKAEKTADAATILSLQDKIKTLEGNIATLSALAEPDNAPNAAVTGASSKGAAVNLADDKQLFGMAGDMFSLDRPYNKRARAAMLAAQGEESYAPVARKTDFKHLQDDLGAFYRTAWRDRIQSFLVLLPSIETIFPLESGYQDLATLVNVWLGDFSQADNTIGSDFDRVTKGSYDFGTETLRMYSVMFAHKFRDLKQLEKTWIGNLNREGSNPVKMSFIEYLLVETAKKLHNEREMRRVNGVRKNPDPNEPGHSLEAADGFYEFIRKKVDGHIDNTPDGGTTGQVVYQIKPFVLGEITAANIGEKIYQGTSMIPAHIRDAGNVALYIPSPLVPLYHKYNEVNYGQNTDYQGGIMYVKEYPSVKLIPVPNADNHHRLVWTIEGNIKCFEQVAGEMLDFNIEQVDWTIKVWSNWKESVWAEAVGKKFTDPKELTGETQLIWCNEYDRPANFFITGPVDKNPSVLLHSSVVTSPGKSMFTITDIDDAVVGKPVNIKSGGNVKIEKKDKFSLLTADWTPEKGDVITLMKRADGKFVEVSRKNEAQSAYMFEADATAPSVADATVFAVGVNTQATALTDLVDAVVGNVYTIHGNGEENATTIANGGKFVLDSDITLKEGAFVQLVCTADGKFVEIARQAKKG